jgi:hypothetical protein
MYLFVVGTHLGHTHTYEYMGTYTQAFLEFILRMNCVLTCEFSHMKIAHSINTKSHLILRLTNCLYFKGKSSFIYT